MTDEKRIKPFVFVCTPYAGDIDGNMDYLKHCMRDCINRGEAPFAPHMMYTQVLDDSRPDDRKKGMELGRDWMSKCDKVVVYVDRGKSEGMIGDIKHATSIGLFVDYRWFAKKQIDGEIDK